MKSSCSTFLFCAALAGLLCFAPAASAQQPSDERVQEASERLQRAPLAPAELQVLMEVSRHAAGTPDLRSRAMAACALAFLMQGETNAFERAAAALRTAYPDRAALLPVTRQDAFVTCADCKGTGRQTTLCPACLGKGSCKTCGGTGRAAAGACPACKGRRACAMCEGKKRIETSCAACKGSAFIFKPSAKIGETYTALLADLAASCQDNIRFGKLFREASKENELGKRIALLEALLQSFPTRPDLADARSLLDQAVKQRDALDAQRRARDTRERETREAETLRLLRDSKELDKAIATLAVYLKEHPGASTALELQGLMDELVAKRARKQTLRSVLRGAGALFGLFLLLALLKPILFRKRPERVGPLPGMDKIDKDDFTDPLALTAKDSRARVKNKTAQIRLPGEADDPR